MKGLRILITGGAGLIGRALTPLLKAEGAAVTIFDRKLDPAQDVRSVEALRAALTGVDGIIHLAAVSRVVDGERDPALCRATNIDATRELLALAGALSPAPWFIQASSREVYGQQDRMPVAEDAPLLPRNVYAHSKVAAEQLVGLARGAGMRTAILRFSNVFGDILDHADRVVPAFARAAANGGTVRVDGGACTFDFTHVSDTAAGIARVAGLLRGGERALPPIHLVGGQQTSLDMLADLAIKSGTGVRRVDAPARNFDVHGFCGDPSRAASLLGWRAKISLQAGFTRLVEDYRSSATAQARA